MTKVRITWLCIQRDWTVLLKLIKNVLLHFRVKFRLSAVILIIKEHKICIQKLLHLLILL